MKKNKILLISPPFSGHLYPLLGLGVHLRKHFEVKIVSTPSSIESIQRCGLESITVFDRYDELIRRIANPPYRVKNNPIRLYKQLRQNMSLAIEMKKEIKLLLDRENPLAVIVDFTLPVIGITAEKMGVPWYTTLPSPCTFECSGGPVSYMGGVFPGTRWYHGARDNFHRGILRCFKKFVYFLFYNKMKEIPLDSVYDRDGHERIYSHRATFALGMIDLEFSRDCPDYFFPVGPILYTPPVKAPALSFKKNRKQILITIGTHLQFEKEAMGSLVERIAKDLPGYMFHYSLGDIQRESMFEEVKENLIVYGFIPYNREMEKYDLVIHHGGSGILYSCLKAGVPALVVPVDYDQFDNAVRLELSGGGKWVRNKKNLTLEIRKALENKEMRKRARELGRILETIKPEEYIEKFITNDLREN